MLKWVRRLWSPPLRWWVLLVLHVLAVILAVLLLWWVNHHFQLGRSLLSPFPLLHDIWLPLLFLLLYVGGWLAWGFFRALSDRPGGDFPDVLAGWNEANGKLAAAGIDLATTPVFLVVGKPRTSTADFFAATKLPFAVRHDGQVVGVHATREAIYLTTDGVSALAKLADFTPAVIPLTPAGPVATLESLLDGLTPDGGAKEAVVAKADAGVHSWLPEPAAAVRTDLSPAELTLCRKRLKYLCELLAHARRPRCPANGVIWLLPMSAVETVTTATSAAAVVRSDLAGLEAGMQLDCPMAAVVADAQELPGFRDLATGLPAGVTDGRLFGRSFPLVPNVPPSDRGAVIASGLEWVAGRLLPALVYQRWGDGPPPEAAARLWRLADALFARREAITRLVAQGLLSRPERPPMLSGVYFAATGPDATDRAFAAGVLKELVLSQNLVSWTETATARERDAARTAFLGYAALVLAAVGLVAFGWWTWNR